MRMPAGRTTLRRAASPANAQTASRPPPVRGWNTVLPLDAMEPGWAIILDNWFPQPGYVELRGGHKDHCDTESALAVETLMAYHGVTSAADKLFAASGDTIYDVTTDTPATAVDSLLNARFQYVNFTTTGGKFLYAVNGEDDPQIYDGTNWTTPAITGITASEIANITSHKGRLWFVLAASTKAAYLPVDSIQGAAATFELGGIFTKGGFLMAAGTWARDGGNGPDDYMVFVSSEGEIAVYAGTDPNSASTWSLIGHFEIGPPMGRRCITHTGADLAIISLDGVLPMSVIPGMERGALARVVLTANIQPTMNQAARNGKDLFGWQLISYPRGTMALLNVPLPNVNYNQFAMNTITGAWTRFAGIQAVCWEIFRDRLFCGMRDGVVCEADIGKADRDTPITFSMKTAFDYFETRGRTKSWKMVRPKLLTGATVSPSIALDVDFRSDSPATPTVAAVEDLATWDHPETLWDDAVWPVEKFFRNEWESVAGVGYCAALRMLAQTDGDGNTKPVLQVNGFDYVWSPGGIL